MKNITRVAVGILRKGETVLACQRRKGDRYELKWEFPGGKLEEGETHLECIKRELREELSIEVKTVTTLDVQTAEYDDGGTYEVTYCLITEFDGEPHNNVFETIRWVPPSDLLQFDILEGNRSFVRQLALHGRP